MSYDPMMALTQAFKANFVSVYLYGPLIDWLKSSVETHIT